jgi:acetyl-CoA carboxylase biotin carboxylase subunit
MKRAIRKLLIANRGEIAVRIIRTARAMNIATVAVYSDADADAMHVAMADEAIAIGPAEAARSYLNAEAIVAAALSSGVDAIHPGYGFLSERPQFARAVADAGLIFVGPRAEVMARLGDKVSARAIAHGAGVPVVPGIETGDPAGVRQFAAREGFPILVKAAAGGGGRGMRIVANADALDIALEAASREANAAFGDGRIFVEKYIARPRHVEIQILADEHGNVHALGERDCSIQRRYQKIIEESPAPNLPTPMRKAMTAAAIEVARAAGYTNAGTVEFIVEDDRYYFLEVNARLQVEHPVTELRFGCDLVEAQLKIAGGEKLSRPDAPRGAAIECRINAEDPAADFRPAIGRVLAMNVPAGPGIRFDSHLYVGAEISPYYDGLLGKLIAYGENRDQAIARMVAALDEFAILGVVNNAGFLRAVIASEPMRRADLSTRFIEEHFPRWSPDAESIDAAIVAAVIASEGSPSALAAQAGRAGRAGQSQSQSSSPWDALRGFELWRNPR